MIAACGGASSPQKSRAPVPARPVLHEATDATDGITDSAVGYTFDSILSIVQPGETYTFRIIGPDGVVQKAFMDDQTKLVHLYAIRDDLADATFMHLHPTMAGDGTWSVDLPVRIPGPYHVYTDFLLQDAQHQVRHLLLRRSFTVPGPFKLDMALPPASMAASVDGYQISFHARPRAWTVMYLPARVTLNGQPFSGLQPYLATFAHFTAFRASNYLVGHAHPLEYALGGRPGGPDLTFHAEFPGSGDYRVFIEFQTNGQLHRSSMTLHVP